MRPLRPSLLLLLCAVGGPGCGTDAPKAPDADPLAADPADPDADSEVEPPDEDTGGGTADPEPIGLPLGETLFFDGDDYMADLGRGADCAPQVVAAPDGALAEVVSGHRLTPDATGLWSLTCGDWSARVQVHDDPITEDTFLNYNYTPTTPVAAVGEDALLVAAPMSNRVDLVRLVAGEPVPEAQVPTGAWPTSVAVWGDYALVAQSGRDSLGFIDLTTLQLVDAIRVGDEPAGVLVRGDTAWVSVSGEDRVVQVDLNARAVVASGETGNDPRSMALSPDGTRLYVASLLSFNEHRFGTDPTPTEDFLRRDLTVLDAQTLEPLHTVPDVGTMLRGLWTDGERLVVGVSHSRNNQPDVDGNARPHAHGLAVLALDEDGLPTGEIEQIDLDYRDGSTGPAPSPFSIAATPDHTQLVVSLSAGRSLLVLDAETLDEQLRLETGHDPRGLVFQGGRLWTSAWLDHSLEGFELPLGESTYTPAQIEVGHDPRSAELRRGQQLFNDATFSATGEFSCNNCHIDGVVDGLTWDLLVDGNVNTIAFRNIAGTDPFLWAGVLPTLFDFSREVLKLVGANASGADMEALTVYMQSITAPPNPHTLPGGRLTEAGVRGKALFDTSVASGGAGCVACHSGPLFTNRTTVVGKTEDLPTDVPGLIGVYDSAPYGRKGHWATLPDMIDGAAAYTGARALTEAQRADLVAYVQQLPGDALWLNGSSPLSGDDYVWDQTPVALTFSTALAPGQEDTVSLHWIDEDGAEVEAEGDWAISGRVLRFTPESGTLAQQTHYVVRVDAGLRATLGQVMADPLVMEFGTGSAASVDTSGEFSVTLGLTEVIPELIGYDPTLSFSAIQSSGGRVTVVMHFDGLGIELSHAEGVVVGDRLIIEPFLVPSDFGELQLDAGYMDLEDLDGDGFADSGEGFVEALGMTIPWWAVRTALPD